MYFCTVDYAQTVSTNSLSTQYALLCVYDANHKGVTFNWDCSYCNNCRYIYIKWYFIQRQHRPWTQAGILVDHEPDD